MVKIQSEKVTPRSLHHLHIIALWSVSRQNPCGAKGPLASSSDQIFFEWLLACHKFYLLLPLFATEIRWKECLLHTCRLLIVSLEDFLILRIFLPRYDNMPERIIHDKISNARNFFRGNFKLDRHCIPNIYRGLCVSLQSISERLILWDQQCNPIMLLAILVDHSSHVLVWPSV